ncbi:MAG TPA: YtxH domain-containing protein [Ktedonobacterales bacterium]|jgi:gas vesicle protein
MDSDDTAYVFGVLLGLFLGTVLGATVALLVAPREGVATRQQVLKEVRRLNEQGEETLSQINRQVQQRSTVPLALAAQPFSKSKPGWRRLWPW